MFSGRKKNPVLKIGIKNDEAAIANAMNLEGYVNYAVPSGIVLFCLAIITESCLVAIELQFGRGLSSGEACSRHSALFDEPIIKTTRAE